MTQMNRLKKAAGSLLALLALILPALPAHAQPEAGPNRNAIGYSVKAVLPENQLDGSGYFNLLMHPGDAQTVYISIVNQLDTPLTVSVEMHDAATNTNGLIVYNEAAGPEKAGQVQLTDYASLRLDLLNDQADDGILGLDGNVLTIAPGGQALVPIEINMPREPVQGQLLGGINVTRVETEDQGGAALAVRSVYRYAVALQVQTDANPAFSPSFTLASVSPMKVAGQDALSLEITNDAPLVISGAALDIQLVPKDGKSTRLDAGEALVSIAPADTLRYTAILPEGLELMQGSYDVRVTWTYKNQSGLMQAGFMMPAV